MFHCVDLKDNILFLRSFGVHTPPVFFGKLASFAVDFFTGTEEPSMMMLPDTVSVWSKIM